MLVGNPLIVMAIMGCMGYRKRTGLFAGLTVAQISEFSLIFIAAGISKGHIKNDVLGLVTLIGLITISISIYMIIYSQVIYRWLEPFLGVFELKTPYREALPEENQAMSEKSYDVLLFGLGRYGQALGSYLKKKNYSVLGVDYDPVAVKNWRKRGLEAVYGDIWDQELFTESFIKHVQWVISAIPHHEFAILQEDPRQSMIDNLKKNHYRGRIAVSSHHPSEAEQLISKGADLIFLPFYDAAERAVEKIEEFNIACQTGGSP